MNEQQIQQLKTSDTMRGLIISTALSVEMELIKFICEYFVEAGKKRKYFFHVVTSKEQMSFTLKSDIALFIIKNEYPDYLKNNGAKMVNLFKKVIALRNDAAHAYLLSDDENNKGDELYLNKFTTKENKMYVRPVPIGKLAIDEHWDNCEYLVNCLIEIQKVINKKN